MSLFYIADSKYHNTLDTQKWLISIYTCFTMIKTVFLKNSLVYSEVSMHLNSLNFKIYFTFGRVFIVDLSLKLYICYVLQYLSL